MRVCVKNKIKMNKSDYQEDNDDYDLKTENKNKKLLMNDGEKCYRISI